MRTMIKRRKYTSNLPPPRHGLFLFVLILLLSHLPLGLCLRKLSKDLTSIYFIGDLHADVSCARQWVEKTNLVNLTTTPFQWLGNPETDALVFLGDYVDKGSASASVLKFVRELQETFPDNVVTMLGNHDFFLVLDTALSFSAPNPHPLGHPFYDYAYSFMHPEEYIESEWSPDRSDDEELLGEILVALGYIYDQDMQGSVHLCAPNCTTSQIDLFERVPPFDQNVTLRERAIERLSIWRQEYAQGLYESGLLQWMTQQPVLAIVGDALVVHGGVSDRVMDYVEVVAKQQGGMNVADAIHGMTNVAFHRFFEDAFQKVNGANQIESRLKVGYAFEIILDMVQHRGYFDRFRGCAEVDQVLDKMNAGLNRIVVGHTPHDYALELCRGKLLASDSSLSRSFRAHGNMYCPLRASLQEYSSHQGGGGSGGSSSGSERRGGSRKCVNVHKDICEGSISRITRASANDAWPQHMQRFRFHELTSDGHSGDATTDTTSSSSSGSESHVKEEL